MWQHWINMFLGLWIIVVAFLELNGKELVWILAITGIVIAILALWGAMGTSSSFEEEELRAKQHMQYQ
jgi:hypothetical protein